MPSGSTQTPRTPILLLSPFMAPLPRSLKSSRIETWTSWMFAENSVKILLLIVIVAIIFKSYTILSTRQNRMLVHQLLCHERDSKSSPSPSLPIRQKETEKVKEIDPPSRRPEDPNQQLQALKEELSQSAFKPIHPWIAPPTPLPGPYDAPYYPLPSIRRLSQDSTTDSPPEEIQAISYIRRVSEEPTFHGTITVSNHGWRRTQWTVSKG
jgi:hypothetical protein